MESEKAKSYLDLLPPEIGARINRLLKAHPTFAMIMDLPYEVRMHVVVKMPYPDVLRFCVTSTEAKIICDDDFFWKLKLEHDFPEKDGPLRDDFLEWKREHENEPGYVFPITWREKYEEHWEFARELTIGCSRGGNVECVESLLQLGIPPDVRWYKDADTALMIASRPGHTDVVRLLLEYGANPDLQEGKGGTALRIASLLGRKDIVRLLLEHGANPNIQDNDGWTALMLVSRYSTDWDIIRLLTKYGADPDLPNKDGDTAKLIAYRSRSRRDIARFRTLTERS